MVDSEDYSGNHLSTEMWFLEYGVITQALKNDLFVYGSILNEDNISAVSLNIKSKSKMVEYKIYVPLKFLKVYNLYNRLKSKTDIISLLRVRRLLKKYGNLNFTSILNKYIKDRCGTKWQVKFDLIDSNKYIDEPDIIDDGSDNFDSSLMPIVAEQDSVLNQPHPYELMTGIPHHGG